MRQWIVANAKAYRSITSLRMPVGFDLGYLLVGLVCLPAIWPLVPPTYFASTDGLYHLFRLLDLDFCIRGWVLYPRWLPNLQFGYGYPVLNYYAPLTYYLAELFHLLGAGFVASIELTFVTGFVLSALSMYLYAKEIMGRQCGLVAATAYVYLPYHLSDCYVKGTLAEFFAFVFFPVILWVFHRLIMRREARYLPLAAASYAGLILTHNLSALIFSPFLMAYVCLLLGLRREIKALAYAFSAILLALFLSAFYWLPGSLESSYVLVGRVSPAAAWYQSYLVPLGELFSRSLIYRYYPEDLGGIGLPFSLAEVGLAGLSILVLIRSWRTLHLATRWHLLFFMGTSLLAISMLLPPSSFIWRSVSLLSYLQFPSRLLLLTTMSNAMLIGSIPLAFHLAEDQPGSTQRSNTLSVLKVAAVVATVLVVMIAHLGRLRVEPEHLLGRDEAVTEETVDLATAADFDYAIGVMVRLWGMTWGLEWLPAWVQAPREEFFLPVQKPPTDRQPLAARDVPSVVLGKQGPLSKALRIQTISQMELSFHTFYFPGWQFYIDGKEARTFPSGPLGLVTTDIAPGDHEILLVFGNTPARMLGTLVSLAGLSALLASALVLVRRKYLVLAPLGLLIPLVPLLWWHVASSPAIQHPVAREANLGNQVKLLGYHLDGNAFRAGHTITVTLYWLALQDMDQDYKVFVHFTDERETRLISQSDRWPVYNFSPTTRWQPGEIVWDRHEIAIPPDATPGTYRLTTGAYLLDTMQNLEVLDEAGNPQGVRVLLSTVEVTP